MVGDIYTKHNSRNIKKMSEILDYIKIFNFSVMKDPINKIKQVTDWKLHSEYKNAFLYLHIIKKANQ